MAIITDGIHLTSTVSKEELHAFAASIKLNRCWYESKKRHPHYDLTTEAKRQAAYAAGAIKVASKQILIQSWWAK